MIKNTRTARSFQTPDQTLRMVIYRAAVDSVKVARPWYCTRLAWAMHRAYLAAGERAPHGLVLSVCLAALPRRVELPAVPEQAIEVSAVSAVSAATV